MNIDIAIFCYFVSTCCIHFLHEKPPFRKYSTYNFSFLWKHLKHNVFIDTMVYSTSLVIKLFFFFIFWSCQHLTKNKQTKKSNQFWVNNNIDLQEVDILL